MVAREQCSGEEEGGRGDQLGWILGLTTLADGRVDGGRDAGRLGDIDAGGEVLEPGLLSQATRVEVDGARSDSSDRGGVTVVRCSGSALSSALSTAVVQRRYAFRKAGARYSIVNRCRCARRNARERPSLTPCHGQYLASNAGGRGNRARHINTSEHRSERREGKNGSDEAEHFMIDCACQMNYEENMTG